MAIRMVTIKKLHWQADERISIGNYALEQYGRWNCRGSYILPGVSMADKAGMNNVMRLVHIPE